MFSFFSKTKILGLDINEEYIRYSLISISGNKKEILLCGEERLPRVEPKNALLGALRNIVNKTKCKNANVSFSPDFIKTETVSLTTKNKSEILSELENRLKEKNLFSFKDSIFYYEKFESINNRDFYNVFFSSSANVEFLKSVFVNSGLKVQKIVSHKDALERSCIRHGEIISTMIVNIKSNKVDICIYNPFNRFRPIYRTLEKENIPEAIKEVHRDFYEISKESIGYYFVAGDFVRDISFINYLSKQTRLPIQQVDVLVNLNLKKDEIPSITREDSLLFALALGVAMS